MTYWQVAAGDRGREYSDLFFKYGIMCVGGENQIKTLRNLKERDIVILKKGRSEILGAGKIIERDGIVNAEDEDWLGDFDGWNLKAYANVEWHRPEEINRASQLLGMGTILKVRKPKLQEKADEIIANYPRVPSEPKPNLNEISKLTDEEIIEDLILKGFRPGNAEELTNTFNRIRLLANFYYKECEWKEVREHETRTFLIIPLLFALGWSEQKLKIELGIEDRKRVDIAAFSKSFVKTLDKEREYCKLIIESKGFQFGLGTVKDQAIAYAESFPNCETVIVSNGFCYKAFSRKGDTFPPNPIAYTNLLKPTNKHPLYPDSKGTLEVFKLLLP